MIPNPPQTDINADAGVIQSHRIHDSRQDSGGGVEKRPRQSM
jgi:hypothetical protein